MKKNIFYYAMALCLAVCNVACSSDDGDEPDNTVTLPTAKYANEAVAYNIDTPVAATDASGYSLKGINFTESGDAVIEVVDNTGKSQFIVAAYEYANSLFTLSGNARGTVQDYTARGTESTTVTISITITIGSQTITFTTTAPVPAKAKKSDETGNTTLDYVARKWNVTGLVLDLEGDVRAFMEFNNGDLNAVANEAIKQGAKISDKEREDFNRNVQNVIIDKNGLITIVYTNHDADVADWTWTNDGQMRLVLKNDDMGNKFFNNNTTISLQFRGTRCVMKFSTKIADGQNYDVALTLRLNAAQ